MDMISGREHFALGPVDIYSLNDLLEANAGYRPAIDCRSLLPQLYVVIEKWINHITVRCEVPPTPHCRFAVARETSAKFATRKN